MYQTKVFKAKVEVYEYIIDNNLLIKKKWIKNKNYNFLFNSKDFIDIYYIHSRINFRIKFHLMKFSVFI